MTYLEEIKIKDDNVSNNNQIKNTENQLKISFTNECKEYFILWEEIFWI